MCCRVALVALEILNVYASDDFFERARHRVFVSERVGPVVLEPVGTVVVGAFDVFLSAPVVVVAFVVFHLGCGWAGAQVVGLGWLFGAKV